VKVGLVEDVAVTLTALLHVGAVIPSHASERANTLASTASSRLRVFIITSNEKGDPKRYLLRRSNSRVRSTGTLDPGGGG
jgi:hypothetical protein